MWRNMFGELKIRPLDNPGLKLLALALSFGLWTMVSAEVSVPHVVANVPVLLESVPSDLAVSEPFSATVDVRVRGAVTRTRDLAPGTLSPTIDLFGATEGENHFRLAPEDIPAPLGVTVDRVEPSSVIVILEERVRRVLPVSPVVEGNPAEGFEIVDKISDPETVAVTGPRERVRSMQSVSTESINVSGRRDSVNRTVNLRSSDGLVTVDGVQQVRLSIIIQEQARSAQLEGIVVRVVGTSYRVDVNPAEIGVVIDGPSSLVAGLTSDNVVATIDASELQPRTEDYQVEPIISFVPADLAAQLEVLALTPQRRLDVHVWDIPAQPNR